MGEYDPLKDKARHRTVSALIRAGFKWKRPEPWEGGPSKLVHPDGRSVDPQLIFDEPERALRVGLGEELP